MLQVISLVMRPDSKICISFTSINDAFVQAIKDNTTGKALYWEPYYAFDGSDPNILNAQPGCVPRGGPVPNTTDAGQLLLHFCHLQLSLFYGLKSLAVSHLVRTLP